MKHKNVKYYTRTLILFVFIGVYGIAFLPVANAESFSRSPAGNGTYQEMTFNVALDDVSSCVTDWSIFGVQFDPFFAEFPLGENVPKAQSSYVFNTQFSSEYNVQQITAGCDGSGGSLSSLEFDGFNVLFSIETYVPPPPPPPVFSPIKFSILASGTNPTVFTSAVTNGVQETGKAIWPMFAFVGIGLAFIIALQLVVFIRHSVAGNKSGGDPVKIAPLRDERGRFRKSPRTGDYKAFKRGKRALKEDGIDLWP